MKKYLAEMVGTMVLVLMGCGAAVSLGCNVADAETVVGTSLAFGLTVVGMPTASVASRDATSTPQSHSAYGSRSA